MSEHREGPSHEPIIGAEQPKSNPTYEQAANNASSTLNNRDLNPKSLTFKEKAMRTLASLGIGIGVGAVLDDRVENAARDTAGEVRDIGQMGVDTVKAPYEVVKDAGSTIKDVLSPESDPGKPRNPDQIMVGSVSVEISKELNVRTSPNIPGKESPGNEIGWDKVKLVNKVEVGNQTQLVPVEFKEGDTLNIENPEYVFGQASGGGFGHDKDAKWLMLYTQNEDGELRAVYVADQAETSQYVKTTSENPRYINVRNSGSEGGAQMRTFSETPPTEINKISIKTPSPQVAQQP